MERKRLEMIENQKKFNSVSPNPSIIPYAKKIKRISQVEDNKFLQFMNTQDLDLIDVRDKDSD